MAFIAGTPAHRDTIVMIAYPGDLQKVAASLTRKVQTNSPENPGYITSASLYVALMYHGFYLDSYILL
jgi:hypothetical protein